MTRYFTYILLYALLSLLPLAASAQDSEQQPESAAVLVADEVTISPERVLTARGNVQVFQGDTGLTAQQITYDQGTGRLLIEGPIRLQDGENMLILASDAELDRDLRNGILRSARMVIDQQVQLAAVQINRVNGRYSQFYKTAATSCRVCDNGKPPLWHIRARRVVHDQQERQLYFDHAQLRVGNIPIFYLPRLRLPDPTLKRATGFLIPRIRSNTQLGTGVEIPYFIRIGDHRDLTLTPYLSPKTRTLDIRYRQAFRTGRIEVNGAATRDKLQPGEGRGYLFASGYFGLRNNYQLSFDIETTSDNAYLNNYGYSYKDRLDSAITLSRTQRDQFFRARAIYYQSLRAGDDKYTLPSQVLDTTFERRFFPARFGGELRLALTAHAHRRSSKTDVQGRDVTRMHAELGWLRSWTILGGLRAQTRLGLLADTFHIAQDSGFPRHSSQVIPQAALALRYPMSKVTPNGARLFLEPIVQLSWAGREQASVPNDESTHAEFDEGNLLALSRFPAKDRREHGAVLAIGVNWARYDPRGWEAYISAGQILREQSNADFSVSSGLRGTTSDFVLAAQIKTQAGLAVSGRALFDSDMEFAKAELRSDWSNKNKKVTLGGTYLWFDKDVDESRTSSISELTLYGKFKLTPHWTLTSNWRYDAKTSRTAYTGFGLGYANECLTVDLSMLRQYSASNTVEPTTTFGLTIGLQGFATKAGMGRNIRSCKS